MLRGSINHTIYALGLYAASSASLLLLNRLTLNYFPLPAFITILQLAFCAGLVAVLKVAGKVEVDDFQWDKVRPYLFYLAAFSLAVVADMKVLTASNIETLLMFRASTPLVVCGVEWWWLGHHWPSWQSSVALTGTLVGTAGYVFCEGAFAMEDWPAYTWCITYLAALSFEICYGRHLVLTVPMHLAGSVMYVNALGIPFLLVFATAVTGEHTFLQHMVNLLSFPGFALLVLSGGLAAGVSFSGWWCRSVLCATAFALAGVLNKVVALLLAAAIWGKPMSSLGLGCLALSLVSGLLYRPPPPGKEADKEEAEVQEMQ
eukprot:EG_transcript_14081